MRVAILIVACVLLAGCGSHRPRPEPPWVSPGVEYLRGYFRGSPTPTTIEWRQTAGSRSVTITFRDPQVCAKCSQAPVAGEGALPRLVTGHRATVLWLRRNREPGTEGTSIAIK